MHKVVSASVEIEKAYMKGKQTTPMVSGYFMLLRTKVLHIVRLHWFAIVAVVSFMAFAAYYMGPSVTACNDTVYGFGDNTAGPIWKFGLPGGQTPLGNFQDYTNHPYGESLYSPIGYSLLLQSTLIWALERIAGPVCGYNLVNFIGFVSSALVMCAFVYWLVRKRWIAFLAGYAVAFAPYFQYKVGGHPSYGYQALLVGVLWLMFKVIKEQKKRDVFLLAGLTAACFYWDPYFSLLVSMIVGPIFIVWGLYSWWLLRKRNAANAGAKNRTVTVAQLKCLLLVVGMLSVLLLPLVAVRVLASNQISGYVSSTRSDGMTDAIFCSNRPWDYVIPADDNWFVGKFLSPSFSQKIQSLRRLCNPSEYNVSVSLVVLAVVSVGFVIFVWEKLNRRKLFKDAPSRMNYKFIVLAVLAMVFMTAMLALPPMLGNLKFPSYVMLQVMDAWRILARLFIVIHIGLITFMAIVLYYFSNQKFVTKAWQRAVLILIVFSLIFVQYQAFAPLSGSRVTFSYSKDVPQIYKWLRDQKNIDYIVAYPLDKVAESEAVSHYLTFQRIHGKKLLNSALPNSPDERLRFSIKDLTDPQTLPILRQLGVDAVAIHGLTQEELEKVPGVRVLKYEVFQSAITGGKIAIVAIDPGPKQEYVIVLEDKFPINGHIMKSAIEVEFEAEQKAVIRIRDVIEDGQRRTEKVCFEAKMADPNDKDILTVKATDGKVLAGPIGLGAAYTPISFTLPEGKEAILVNKTGHNMRLNNIGCK